jgi:hypothetical protein
MTMRKAHCLVPAVLAATLVAVTVQAQELEAPRRRQGYYLGGGYSGGGLFARDNGASLPSTLGVRSVLRAGQLVTRRFGLGLYLESMAGKRALISTAQSSLGLDGHFAVAGNLALRASVGFGVLQIKDDGDTDPDSKLKGNYGAQFGVGLSYDWFPWHSSSSGGFAIAPAIELRTLPGESASSVAAFIGAECVWWTGLPRNQLQLPESEAYEK